MAAAFAECGDYVDVFHVSQFAILLLHNNNASRLYALKDVVLHIEFELTPLPN